MSLFSDEISAAYGEVGSVMSSIGTDDPATVQQFTWNGTPYDAVSIVEIKGELFGAGGATFDNHLTITARASVFTGDQPEPLQKVVFNSHDYRIQTIESSPDGTGLTIRCNDANRGAGIIPREM